MQSLLRNHSARPKLTMSRPEDSDEREADQAADAVVANRPLPPLADHSGGAPCSHCSAVRRQNSDGMPGALAAARSMPVMGFMQSGGRPLTPGMRREFESNFDTDLSSVRIHEGAAASSAADAFGAQAFTIGSDIAFAPGKFAPSTRAGHHLLAHELAHVVQRAGTTSQAPKISRQVAPGANPGASTDTPQAEPQAPRGSPVLYFRGVPLVDDRAFVAAQLRHLIAQGGLAGADEFVAILNGAPPSGVPLPLPPAHLTATGSLRPHTPLDAIREDQDKQLREHLAPLVTDVYQKEVRPAAVQFLLDFEVKARANAEATLQANEQQAKTEAFKYGITSTQITKTKYTHDEFGVSSPEIETHTVYSMKDSTEASGLRDAAKVLLGRRREIDQLFADQSKHIIVAEGILVPDSEFPVIGKQIQEKKEAYTNLRAVLSTEHPALAAFSDLEQGSGALQTIAEKGAGADTATLIGERIAQQLGNIARVREGLASRDVNVWRQEKIVGLTNAQFGVAEDPTKARLVNDKVASEQPGILAALGLLVLNVAALLLAGPTGGLSLVVAAGVNVAVTAAHVQDYLMESALSGTAFDKAQAISKEEPSLFWLAIEIAGTAFDVGTAAPALFKAFRTLAPLVKAAATATEGEKAIKSLETLRIAAQEGKGARGVEFAEKVVAQTKSLRKGEAAVVEGAQITEAESKLLRAAGQAAEAEAATDIGKALKTATGEMHLSKAGHLFSCSSPCTELAAKYAEVFAKDSGLAAELAAIESRGAAAAEARRLAEASKDSVGIAKAEELAAKVKADAAGLESRIISANPQLAAIAETEEAVTAIKQVEAEEAVAKGRYPKDAAALEKVRPVAENPPKGVDPADPLWKDYLSYFDARLKAIKEGVEGAKPPLTPEAFMDFLGKFRRGTKFQEGVLAGLEGEKNLPVAQRTVLGEMKDPIVESNVGIAGKGKGENTKFVDQLVVDGATVGEGKIPDIVALSNKSRAWPETLNASSRASSRTQVIEDATEALTKYGGEVTLRRPDGPLQVLFNQPVKVSKVILVYDRAFVKTAELENLIKDAAKGVKINGQQVSVIFR